MKKILLFALCFSLVFVVASFYLVMTYYHSEEVKTTVYVSQNDINYQSYKKRDFLHEKKIKKKNESCKIII